MATLHPFRAIRPIADKVKEIACVPYDVINTEEARGLAAGNPLSFLHVIRPEIDLPDGVSEYDDAVYAKGSENLTDYVAGDFSIQDDEPSVYVYRQIMDGRSQTGIFGCVSVADYDNDVILKHELTRPTKEDDRTRHIVTQSAHAEPIMLTYRDSAAVNSVVDQTITAAPVYDFVANDGVQHTVWRVGDTGQIVEAFDKVANLYVADGHHRCKSASRAAAETDSDRHPEVDFFPAVLFPMGDMKILPYNRIVRKLPVPAADFLALLQERFEVTAGVDPDRTGKGTVSVLLEGVWYGFALPQATTDSVADQLDVARLSEFVLAPLLSIVDQRRDPNIDFVGGIRGTGELERVVSAGLADMAISLHATSVVELVDVSDAGQLMPPKSTWFEPKLRSGLLVHLF